MRLVMALGLCALGGCDGTAAPSSLCSVQAVGAADVQTVFSARCANAACHSGAQPQAHLDLSSLTASCAALKGSHSCEFPTLLRADPEAPSASVLVRKLNCANADCTVELGAAAPACNVPTEQRMPYLQPALESCEIDAVTRWISRGMEGCP